MPGAILRSAFRRKGGAGDESAAHAKRLGQVSVNSDYAPALGAESREKKLVVTDNSDYLKKKRLEKKKKKENEKEKRRWQRELEAGHVGAAVESGKATRICCCLCVLGRPKVSEPAVFDSGLDRGAERGERRGEACIVPKRAVHVFELGELGDGGNG